MILQSTAELSYTPQRIISVVPSQTELLFSLGLEEETIGITKFCIHPKAWFRSKTRIGGTKKLDLGKIRSLQPDLIIANKEENLREEIEPLATEFPVWVTDINDLADALQMIRDVGELTGRKDEAQIIVTQIQTNFQLLLQKKPTIRTAYLIWKEPYMTIGADTFIHAMMQLAGLENVFADKTRYPEISIAAIKEARTDLLLLSSEPFPFSEKHLHELQVLLPGCKILLANGEMFSWYGSRLINAPQYFLQLRNQISAVKTL
ncbi:MAG: transporter substrate-binding protein [Ferruginibacter sp.]|nr:transporter substrate-binding protein [Ferruginibacter sp.]